MLYRLAWLACLLSVISAVVYGTLRIAGAGIDTRPVLASSFALFCVSVIVRFVVRPADPRVARYKAWEEKLIAMQEAIEAKAREQGIIKPAFQPTADFFVGNVKAAEPIGSTPPVYPLHTKAEVAEREAMSA